jgi:hypothetical protein
MSVVRVFGCVDLIEHVTQFVDNENILSWSMVCSASRKSTHNMKRIRDPTATGLLAASIGCIELLEFAARYGCTRDSRICNAAAASGNLNFIQVARVNSFEWGGSTCYAAVKNGFLDVLEWLVNNSCPVDPRICAVAARNADIETLMWARENGCPWDDMTASEAAYSQDFEVLKWVWEKGCPWDVKTSYALFHMAYENNTSFASLQWAVDNGCQMGLVTLYTLALGNKFAAFIAARQFGFPWNESVR